MQNGFPLPNGASFTIDINSASQKALYYDSNTIVFSPPSLQTFSITQRDKIGLSNSQHDIFFQLPSSLGAPQSSGEALLVLKFPNPLFEADLGASDGTFNIDDMPYYNGMPMPALLSKDFGTSTEATLHQGDGQEPALIIIPITNGLSTVQEAISLAYIKNPSANKGISLDISIVTYTASQGSSQSGVQAKVVYEASYINYFNTLLEDPTPSNNNQLKVAFTSLNPFQATTMILSGKDYGTDVDLDSKIYVKLKSNAQGFDYKSTKDIKCDGYTLQWFQSDYIFYLTPVANQGTHPTIACSGFVLGGSIQELIVETGINKENYRKVVSSTGTELMQLAGSIPGDSLQVTRLNSDNNIPNVGSVNIYQISYNASSFIVGAGGAMILQIPSSLEILPDRLNSATVTGLVDRTSGDVLRAVTVLLNGTNLIIRGYDTYTTTKKDITITLFLRNKVSGQFNFGFQFLDVNDKLVAQSSKANSQAFTIEKSPNIITGTLFGPFLTDTVDVYADEQYPILFNLQVANTINSSLGGQFQVTIPDDFDVPLNQQFLCKYSTDSVNWIRSTNCSLSSGIMTIPLVSGFDILANSNVLLLLTSETALTNYAGFTRPNTPVINNFTVKSQNQADVLESVLLPLVIYPSPTDNVADLKWYTRGSREQSIIEVSFTTNVALQPTDFFELELVTYNELQAVFPYGGTDRLLGNCADDPSIPSISNNATVDCFIARGRTTIANRPAKAIIRAQDAVKSGDKVRFFYAAVTNPASGVIGGYIMNVMRPCRDDGYGCPILRNRDYVTMSDESNPSKRSMATPTLDKEKTDLFVSQVMTTFTLHFDYTIATTDALIFKTNTTNIPLTSECQTSSGVCIHFPAIGWTFYQPSAAITSTKQVSLLFDNAVFYDRSEKLDFVVEAWLGGKIKETLRSDHPNYSLLKPTLSTVPTQAEPSIQRILRNFDNIFAMSMDGIWRSELVDKIIVNIPDSYAPLDDGYCRAGVNLDNISDESYIEFPCMKQPEMDRQIIIVIDVPWQKSYQELPVLLYFRGFLPQNESYIGKTNPSTITSYASLTENWVVDENTNYRFVVDPDPTPVIRNISLNLKSFYDREATILDLVEFYGAIWPNTPYNASDPNTQITQMLFQIDDLFAYPSVYKLMCETKAIFQVDVDCILKRNQGRTEILVNTPPNYQHSPFLVLISNTPSTVLFQAPDREGSFLFNLTFLNTFGLPVEKADSYVSIGGDFVVNFIAEPILQDPLVETLYDIQFTTQGRVTPQGFFQPGLSVYTKIVLLFQTYSSAFPIDLGSGLPNNSQISCIPVNGLTVKSSGNLTCTLVYGNSLDPTMIIITGYDPIANNTKVRIFIDQINTLAAGQTSRIQLEIRSFYTAINEQYIFYNALAVSPNEPSAYTGNTPAPMTMQAPSSTTLQGTSSYTFTFKTTTSLTANQDYILIEFPDYGYEQDDNYSTVAVSITSPSVKSHGYIMPKSSRVYVQPTADIPTGDITLTIKDLPTPSFYLQGNLTFTIETIVNAKTTDVFTEVISYTSTSCDLFKNVEIVPTSNMTRINDNTYEISFTILHTVPPTGSLAVVFDPTLYNLRSSNPTCQPVSGFSPEATCSFELFSQQLVRINLNGFGLDPGSKVKVNISGINNPTESTQAPVITIESFFDDAYGTTKKICSRAISLPLFQHTELIQCPINVEPEINNAGEATDYLITFSCASDIRDNTTLEVQFPPDYQNSFNSASSCSFNGNLMLQPSSLLARTLLFTTVISKPQSEDPLVLRIRDVLNPSLPGSYGPITANLYQYGVLYGEPDTAGSNSTVTITSNYDVLDLNNNLAVSIFPRNYGEKATYYFRLVGFSPSTIPQELLVKFDDVFAEDLGSSISCGTFVPQGQYGDSYALNYKTMVGFESIPCSVTDSYLLRLELDPSIDLDHDQQKDIFFFVDNIYNPNIIPQSPASAAYSFLFILKADQSAIAISHNIVRLAFELPPSLIEITNITSTDNNILAPADYTFTLLALSELPSAGSPGDFELALALPQTYYKNFSLDSSLEYSFPGIPEIQYESSAFQYKDLLLFDAMYPDLSSLGPFNLTLSNMTNPSKESQCGPNGTWPFLTFGAQYLSRVNGFVYARTYSIMNQQDCLPLGKYRIPIEVTTSPVYRQGLVYKISLHIPEPTTGLVLTPWSDTFGFEPTSVRFNDYTTTSVEIEVFVLRSISPGEYTISWKKQELRADVRYLEIADTNVIVVSEGALATVTPLPRVHIENFLYIWSGAFPKALTVTLDQEPAEELILYIEAQTSDKKLQGSADGTVYSEFPITLTFAAGEGTKQFYLFAEEGSVDNVLTYTLGGTNAGAYSPEITTSPFTIKVPQSKEAFQLLSVQQDQIHENTLKYNVSLNDVGTIHYLAIVRSSLHPTESQIINGSLLGISQDLYKSGSVVLDYSNGLTGTLLPTSVEISGLRAQTDYKVYFIAINNFGDYSSTFSTNATTLQVNGGASILLQTFGNVNTSSLINALSLILSLPTDRLIIEETNEVSSKSISKKTPQLENRLSKYKIGVIPDQYNNSVNPITIANRMLDKDNQDALLALIPQFMMDAGIRVTPIKGNIPTFITPPRVTDITYYTLSLQAELIGKGVLYGIAVVKNSPQDVQPTSYQISHGLLANNMNARSWFCNMTRTDENGGAVFILNELDDNTEYSIYLTAGNDVPYEPVDLLADSGVVQVLTKTLKNPNLGTIEEALKLYKDFYGEPENSAVRSSIFAVLVTMLLYIIL